MRYPQRLFFWFCWPALFVYFYRSRRTRVLISNGDDTLLVKGWWGRWFGDDVWGLPGGGLRFREQPATGLARELSEELGLRVDPADLHYLGDEFVREYGIGYKGYFFLLKIDGAKPKLKQNYEILEASWFDFDNLADDVALKSEVVQARNLLDK